MVLTTTWRPSSIRSAQPAIAFRRSQRSDIKCRAQLGLLYASCTGSTQLGAALIKANLGNACSEPIDVQQLPQLQHLQHFSGYLVGSPTWNTNAACQRTGTAWDDLLYNGAVQQLQLQGKPVAVFGFGDAVRFKHHFADAIAEVHDVFMAAGAVPLTASYVDSSGYLMTASKSLRLGSDGRTAFVGLPLDHCNQPDLTQSRVHQWCRSVKRQLQEQFPDVLLPANAGQPRASAEIMKGTTEWQQQQQQQLNDVSRRQIQIGDWPAEWPQQNLFQGQYPKGFRFMDRWYKLGDRWYRFADDGFQVRAGFREHTVYCYAYRDIQAVQLVSRQANTDFISRTATSTEGRFSESGSSSTRGSRWASVAQLQNAMNAGASLAQQEQTGLSQQHASDGDLQTVDVVVAVKMFEEVGDTDESAASVLDAAEPGLHCPELAHQHQQDDVMLLFIKDVDTYSPDGSNTIYDFLKCMQHHVATAS